MTIKFPIIKKVLFSVIFATTIFYAAKVLGFIGMALAGAGHGSAVLGYPFLSPIYNCKGDTLYCFGPYLWAIAGASLPWTSRWYVGVLLIVVVGINFFGAVKDITHDLSDTGTAHYALSVFQIVPGIAIPIAAVYLSTMVYIFWKFMYLKLLHSSERNKSQIEKSP